MNCEDFNNIIDELADDPPMSAAIRDAGVSHAALCPGCAAKLADARAVGSFLLAATRAESEQAPANVKQNLLAAFADFQRRQATPARVVDISSRRAKRSWMAAAAAIAAVILLAMAVSIWKKASAPGRQPSGEFQANASGTPASPGVNDLEPGSAPVKKSSLGEKPGLSSRIPGNNSRKAKRVTPDSGSPGQAIETVAQSAGQYVPLTYLAQGMSIDSGTVVRVELSRSALASLGFRGGVEGTAESVKAEVILGDDGVARAIRLVE
jgi:hypothetical protein